MMVQDRPGVIAAVTDALARAEVSIDSFLQRSAQNSGLVPIVLTTHVASESAIAHAVEEISALDAVVEAPRFIRIAKI
jgi:homoserine dehydrogenase